jgi:hypothetical protein
MLNKKVEPFIEDEDFVDFLIYLKDKEGYTSDALISVIEKPWKYKDEYLKFYKENYGSSN